MTRAIKQRSLEPFRQQYFTRAGWKENVNNFGRLVSDPNNAMGVMGTTRKQALNALKNQGRDAQLARQFETMMSDYAEQMANQRRINSARKAAEQYQAKIQQGLKKAIDPRFLSIFNH